MYAFLIVGFIFTILEWIGELKENKWLIVFAKPLVIILILVWIISSLIPSNVFDNEDIFPIVWFILGLFFGLIGDIFLMMPEKFFVSGLTAFLIGHVLYILGFRRIIPPEGNFIPGSILAIMILIVSMSIYRKISQGLLMSGKARMEIPVAAYSCVISIMLYSAFLTLLDRNWSYSSALWVSFGALSFYLSDILNAWLRFVSPIRLGRLKIMMLYHIAQFSLAIGSVIHYVYRPDS
jgi:uncharacterized membrane protein YhhN